MDGVDIFLDTFFSASQHEMLLGGLLSFFFTFIFLVGVADESFFPHTENMQIEPPKNFREDFFMQKKLILFACTDFLITFF